MLDRKINLHYLWYMDNTTAASILARGKAKKKTVSHEHLLDAAYALGGAGGKIGGPARAQAMSKQQRKDCARHAACARWGTPCGCSTFCK